MIHMPKIYNTYLVAMIAIVGGMLFGFDISSMSAIVGTTQYLENLGNPHGIVQGAIGSFMAAGSVVGSLMAGPFSNRFGRRDSIFFACFCGSSELPFKFLVDRRRNSQPCLRRHHFISSPCLPRRDRQKEKRGSIIVIQQLAIDRGIFIMFFAGYGCSSSRETHLSAQLGVFNSSQPYYSCVWTSIPSRSSRWLAKLGRNEEAIKTLADIQASGKNHDPLIVAEWEEI